MDVGALASLVIGLPTLCDRDLEVAPDHVPLQPPDRSDLEESDSWQINLDRIGCHAGLSASANKVLPGPDGHDREEVRTPSHSEGPEGCRGVLAEPQRAARTGARLGVCHRVCHKTGSKKPRKDAKSNRGLRLPQSGRPGSNRRPSAWESGAGTSDQRRTLVNTGFTPVSNSHQ